MEITTNRTNTPVKRVFDKNSCIEQIETIDFLGNITPKAWYKNIKTDTGKTDSIAINLLSEIVYHYRRITSKENSTEYVCQFSGDMWSQTNRQFAQTFEYTKLQITSALVRLEKMGLIIREWRTVLTAAHGYLPNVQFLAPVAEKVCAISVVLKKKEIKKSRKVFQKNKGVGTPLKCGDLIDKNSDTLQRELKNDKEEASTHSVPDETDLPERPITASAKVNEKDNHQTITSVPSPNVQLKLVPDDNAIKTALSINQTAFVLKKLNGLSPECIESYASDLFEEVLVGMVDLTCFSGCGVEFQRKINTIIKAIKNGTWTPPKAFLLQKKSVEAEDKRVENEMNKPLNVLKEKHRSAWSDYHHFGKMAKYSTTEKALANNLAIQKAAWDSLVLLTNELKALNADIKLPSIPSVPEMIEHLRKTA
jgi:hypothetical protein